MHNLISNLVLCSHSAQLHSLLSSHFALHFQKTLQNLSLPQLHQVYSNIRAVVAVVREIFRSDEEIDVEKEIMAVMKEGVARMFN